MNKMFLKKYLVVVIFKILNMYLENILPGQLLKSIEIFESFKNEFSYATN